MPSRPDALSSGVSDIKEEKDLTGYILYVHILCSTLVNIFSEVGQALREIRGARLLVAYGF